MKAEYAQKAKELGATNAYTAAITDYMRKPQIEEIDIEGYQEKEGDSLSVEVYKKGFKVQEVEMLIKDSYGKVVERGRCIEKADRIWQYHSSSTIQKDHVYNVLVRVKERTGNIYEKSIELIIT